MDATVKAEATAARRVVPVAMPTPENEARHRLLVHALYGIAIAVVLAVSIYGFDYYTLPAAQRPYSPKFHLLRPSGPVGILLGVFGVSLFLGIFLYPLRKKWSWLSRQGNSRHWLNIHIVMGLTAPFIIAYHATFKFQGIAGVAFWFMFAVALSGVVGRYLYTQIPRTLNAAELTRKELEELHAEHARDLAEQKLLPEGDLRELLRLPSAERIAQLPLAAAVPYMMMLDVVRVFRVSRLRRRAIGGVAHLTTLGGFLKTGNAALERAIETALAEASLSKRILFLSYSQRIFNLWHHVHKPFSYAFAVLAVLHIGMQLLLGFY